MGRNGHLSFSPHPPQRHPRPEARSADPPLGLVDLLLDPAATPAPRSPERHDGEHRGRREPHLPAATPAPRSPERQPGGEVLAGSPSRADAASGRRASARGGRRPTGQPRETLGAHRLPDRERSRAFRLRLSARALVGNRRAGVVRRRLRRRYRTYERRSPAVCRDSRFVDLCGRRARRRGLRLTRSPRAEGNASSPSEGAGAPIGLCLLAPPGRIQGGEAIRARKPEAPLEGPAAPAATPAPGTPERRLAVSTAWSRIEAFPQRHPRPAARSAAAGETDPVPPHEAPAATPAPGSPERPLREGRHLRPQIEIPAATPAPGSPERQVAAAITLAGQTTVPQRHPRPAPRSAQEIVDGRPFVRFPPQRHPRPAARSAVRRGREGVILDKDGPQRHPRPAARSATPAAKSLPDHRRERMPRAVGERAPQAGGGQRGSREKR